MGDQEFVESLVVIVYVNRDEYVLALPSGCYIASRESDDWDGGLQGLIAGRSEEIANMTMGFVRSSVDLDAIAYRDGYSQEKYNRIEFTLGSVHCDVAEGATAVATVYPAWTGENGPRVSDDLLPDPAVHPEDYEVYLGTSRYGFLVDSDLDPLWAKLLAQCLRELSGVDGAFDAILRHQGPYIIVTPTDDGGYREVLRSKLYFNPFRQWSRYVWPTLEQAKAACVVIAEHNMHLPLLVVPQATRLVNLVDDDVLAVHFDAITDSIAGLDVDDKFRFPIYEEALECFPELED